MSEQIHHHCGLCILIQTQKLLWWCVLLNGLCLHKVIMARAQIGLLSRCMRERLEQGHDSLKQPILVICKVESPAAPICLYRTVSNKAAFQTGDVCGVPCMHGPPFPGDGEVRVQLCAVSVECLHTREDCNSGSRNGASQCRIFGGILAALATSPPGRKNCPKIVHTTPIVVLTKCYHGKRGYSLCMDPSREGQIILIAQ